ncbi:hypothetical protein SBBP1_370003 [Burkholderiales bacterium]|nr:hypothetical protein SBBP1_370003 [Burkholderiales bacterium]
MYDSLCVPIRRGIAWQESLRLPRATNNAPPFWLLPAPAIVERRTGRAVLLTLAGWASPKIAAAFGVREDTIRLWRSDFANGDVAALKASVAPALVGSPRGRSTELDATAPARRDRSAPGRAHQPFAAVQGAAKKSSVGGGRGTH